MSRVLDFWSTSALGSRMRRAVLLLGFSSGIVFTTAPIGVAAESPSVYDPPTAIIAMAADAVRDATSMPGDGSFQIRNYTDKKIKTCFYYPDDDVMLVPLGIREDKDNCYSTPAAGNKKYRTDKVRWSKFRGKPGYHHTLERELNVKVFRKIAGINRLYCKRKGIFQPDQLRVTKDGKNCKITVVRTFVPKHLRSQGITKGGDVLRWTEAHRESLNYLVARNSKYVFVSFRGTSNNANKKMNGELTLAEAGGDAGEVRASKASARPALRKGASVHFGWWKAAGKVFDQVEPTLRDWAGKKGKKREIVVTGHSMGGAVATYLAFKLMDDGYDKVHLVTFGSPRVTTKSFVQKFNALTETNSGDVAFVETEDDPRVLDWTSKMEKIPTITIWEPRSYDAHFVMYPGGCPDPHAGALYAAFAKNGSHSCIPCEERENCESSEGGRRRIGGRPRNRNLSAP